MRRATAALTLALLVGPGCREPSPTEEILRPVRTEEVVRSSDTRIRTFAGTSRAGQETELSFRVSGRVESLDVRIGQQVARGQRIAALETTDFELQVQEDEANLAQARANLRNAEQNLDRIRRLWETGNTSKNELDAAEAGFQSARARVDASAKTLESSRRKLGYTTLSAPVDGAIADVLVEVNENVIQGQTVVLLTSGSRPEVEVAMPGVLISEVEPGAPVIVSFDSFPGQSFQATVTEVGVAATGAATTFPVRVRLTRENDRVRSGMSAEVAFEFDTAGPAGSIVLPSVAVGEDRDGRFVFVLEPSGEPGVGIVHRRPVRVDPAMTAEGFLVLSGVEVGDSVVTAGVRRLRDGQRVRLSDG
jgi:RND family efflux transporter MFP subunit